MPTTAFEIKKMLDKELEFCPGRWEKLGNKKWYTEKEVKELAELI